MFRTAIRDDGGQALVELAVHCIDFHRVASGAAEFANLAYAAIEVSNAARAGVAWMARQSSSTASNLAAMQTAATATNDGANVSGLHATASEFWSCSNAPSTQSSTPPTCTAGNHLLNYVQGDDHRNGDSFDPCSGVAGYIHTERSGNHESAIAAEARRGRQVVRRQSLDRIRVMSLRECRFRAQASETLGHARSECGASLVEFALSVMVMLTFILGVMTMCTALYSYHFVAEAAREGARYAIVRGSGCTTYSGFTSNCPISTAAPIQTYVRSLALPGINASNLNRSCGIFGLPFRNLYSVGCMQQSGKPGSGDGNYQLPVTIPFVPARTLTMTSRSQMVIAD